ncbi:MAG: hypothetical protein QNJ22_12895 [Desulfosarcinaceae bacterium]|nr:hypothetical protein [Desulfosarcinaceae bacterium]
MRIVYLHYHLKPGGVTTVLRQQASALARDHELLILSGSPPPDDLAAPAIQLADLDYDHVRQTAVGPADLADAITSAIHATWPTGCDLIHVHNPTLVKNRALLPALERLQRAGQRLLLQIHDFAEDGRPEVYTRSPYPADCHYAVINSRDRSLLRAAGLRPEGCHLLPNMVTPLPPAGAVPPARGQVLYPVRAIRRKNIGEALLLAQLLRPGLTLGITLPPTSPADQKSYGMWRRLAEAQGLGVAFEVGVGRRFSELVHAAPFLITTSITEGFGFSFLEPWTARRAVWGRRLAAICGDFEAHGIDLGHLYSHLRIPVEWFDRADFAARWLGAYNRAHRQFGLSLSEAAAQRVLEGLLLDDKVDFGLLHETHQVAVLRELAALPDGMEALTRRHPDLKGLGSLADADRRIRNNRQKVLDHYGPDGYRRQLTALYQAARRPVRQHIDKAALCRAFLRPEQFSLLKWSAYDA